MPKHLLKTIVITAGLFVSAAGQAQTALAGEFVQLDFDCGGYVTGFAAHPKGRIYARANVGGLYRSDDRGETWKWLSGDLPYGACHIPQSIAVAPGNPDVVYQAVGVSYSPEDPGRGVWKSTDGGRTWAHLLKGVNFAGNDEVMYGGPCLVLNPADENEVWAITRGFGVYRSVDAGTNWSRMDGNQMDGLLGAGICIHPKYPDQIWVTGEGGLFLSLDRGQRWTKMRSFTRGYRIARLNDGTVFVAGSDHDINFLLRISAKNWSDIRTCVLEDLGGNFQGCWGSLTLLTVLRDERTIFTGCHNLTWISTNRGKTWTSFPVAMDPSSPRCVWMRDHESPLDWGRSEMVQDPVDPDRLYLATGNCPVYSVNGGQSWRNMPNGLAEICSVKAAFLPDRPDVVIIPCADEYGFIIADGGKSGKASLSLNRLLPNRGVGSVSRVLTAKNRIVLLISVFGERGARLAVSGGDLEKWEQFKPGGIPLNYFGDGVMSPDDPDDFLLVAGERLTGPGQGGIYRTTDGGRNFRQCAGLPDGNFIGAGWSHFNCLQADPRKPGYRYFILNGQGFFRSTDRGRTWRRAGEGLKGNAGVLSQDPTRPGRLWAAMSGEGLYTSADRGSHWTPAGDFMFPYFPYIDAHEGRLVVFGRRPGDEWDKIYYSPDSGKTWSEITRPGYRFPTTAGLAFDPHDRNRIWISTAGRSSALFIVNPTGEDR